MSTHTTLTRTGQSWSERSWSPLQRSQALRWSHCRDVRDLRQEPHQEPRRRGRRGVPPWKPMGRSGLDQRGWPVRRRLVPFHGGSSKLSRLAQAWQELLLRRQHEPEAVSAQATIGTQTIKPPAVGRGRKVKGVGGAGSATTPRGHDSGAGRSSSRRRHRSGAVRIGNDPTISGSTWRSRSARAPSREGRPGQDRRSVLGREQLQAGPERTTSRSSSPELVLSSRREGHEKRAKLARRSVVTIALAVAGMAFGAIPRERHDQPATTISPVRCGSTTPPAERRRAAARPRRRSRGTSRGRRATPGRKERRARRVPGPCRAARACRAAGSRRAAVPAVRLGPRGVSAEVGGVVLAVGRGSLEDAADREVRPDRLVELVNKDLDSTSWGSCDLRVHRGRCAGTGTHSVDESRTTSRCR